MLLLRNTSIVYFTAYMNLSMFSKPLLLKETRYDVLALFYISIHNNPSITVIRCRRLFVIYSNRLISKKKIIVFFFVVVILGEAVTKKKFKRD